MQPFFFCELQLIKVLLFNRDSYTSLSTRFVSLKVCGGFSKIYIFVQQKAWIRWHYNVIISFKIKIIEKAHARLLPNF